MNGWFSCDPQEPPESQHQEPAPPEPSPASPVTPAQALAELSRRAGEGNESCLAGLRQLLDQRPEIWQAAGSVTGLIERMWAELLASGNRLVEESILRKVKELKAELAEVSATPLEALLVDYIGITYLAAMHGEISAAQDGGSVEQVKLRLRRAESGHKRFTGAVKALSLVRALMPRKVVPVEGKNASQG
jgi:hypothetical protein